MNKDSSSSAKPMWSCPFCGRQFAQAQQAHSCRVHGIDDHFRGKDLKLRSTFDALQRAFERSGPFRIDAVQSTINLISKHHFGGIAVRRTYLRVGFILDHEVHDARIVRTERVGPHRVSHQVHVRSLDNLDAQLIGWLVEAQTMQLRETK